MAENLKMAVDLRYPIPVCKISPKCTQETIHLNLETIRKNDLSSTCYSTNNFIVVFFIAETI